MMHAKVFGWGAVERLAAKWSATAKVVEVQRSLWEVREDDGTPIGAIGKDPLTLEAIARHAARMVELAGAPVAFDD